MTSCGFSEGNASGKKEKKEEKNIKEFSKQKEKLVRSLMHIRKKA